MGDHAGSLTAQLELFVDAESHICAATSRMHSIIPADSYYPARFSTLSSALLTFALSHRTCSAFYAVLRRFTPFA